MKRILFALMTVGIMALIHAEFFYRPHVPDVAISDPNTGISISGNHYSIVWRGEVVATIIMEGK